MYHLSRRSILLLVCALVVGSILSSLFVVIPAQADMGVQPILPGGSSIGPERETPIQMAAEKVVLNVRPTTEADDTIVTRNPGEYGLPAAPQPGLPAGMYPAVAEVLADFTMRNPTGQAVTMTAWFPLASALETEEWILDPGQVVPSITKFQVSIDGKPLDYTVSELPNPRGTDKPPLPWASFPVTFPARQDTHVQISYAVPAWWSYEGLAMNLYYVLQTGAGWAGPIGKAELVVNLPYPASAETIWRMPEGGQLKGHQARWTWEDLEPGPRDDFSIQLLLLSRWDELQAARAAVTANPQDGEAWLNLAATYRLLARGAGYSAAHMLPGFGEIYQPLGVQAAREALRLLPGDGRPHDELALLYASALPENASWEDLKPVMEELKIVEELEPALAPNIHDTLDFLGATWAVETVHAAASALPQPAAGQPPAVAGTSAAAVPAPLPSATAPVAATIRGQVMILGTIAILIVLAVLAYLLWSRIRARADK